MVILDLASLNLRTVERSARLAMSVVAATAAIVAITFKTGLVSTTATYDRQSWYLVTTHDGFVITSQLDDEGACRKREEAGAVCRSGASMAEGGSAPTRR